MIAKIVLSPSVWKEKFQMKQLVIICMIIVLLIILAGGEHTWGEVIAWWHLDEGQGKEARDETDSKAHLNLIGDVKWTKGIKGKALEFNGQKESYAISKNAEINFPASFTIEGWFKAFDLTGGFILDTVADVDNGEATNVIIWIGVGIAKDWQKAPVLTGRFWTQNGGWESFLSTKEIQTDRWYYFAYLFDTEVPEQLLYLNGRKVNSVATLGNRLFHQQGAWNAYVLGANAENNDFGAVFQGIIDEVRVHDEALTQEEIKQSMTELAVTPSYQALAITWGEVKYGLY